MSKTNPKKEATYGDIRSEYQDVSRLARKRLTQLSLVMVGVISFLLSTSNYTPLIKDIDLIKIAFLLFVLTALIEVLSYFFKSEHLRMSIDGEVSSTSWDKSEYGFLTKIFFWGSFVIFFCGCIFFFMSISIFG